MFQQAKPCAGEMGPGQIGSYRICEQEIAAAERIRNTPSDIDEPQEKIFTQVGASGECEIEFFGAQNAESTEEIEPERGERIVLCQTRIVLRPGHFDFNNFVDQALVAEKRRAFRAGQDSDVRGGILQPQTLEKRELHRDIADVPVFENENFFRFPGELARNAETVDETDQGAKNGLSGMNHFLLAWTHADEDSQGSGIRSPVIGWANGRSWCDLDQDETSPHIG